MQYDENKTDYEDPRFDPKWTAYVLGELDQVERASVEAELAGDEALRAFVDELRATAALLEEGLSLEGAGEQAAFALTAEQRASIAAAAEVEGSSESSAAYDGRTSTSTPLGSSVIDARRASGQSRADRSEGSAGTRGSNHAGSEGTPGPQPFLRRREWFAFASAAALLFVASIWASRAGMFGGSDTQVASAPESERMVPRHSSGDQPDKLSGLGYLSPDSGSGASRPAPGKAVPNSRDLGALHGLAYRGPAEETKEELAREALGYRGGDDEAGVSLVLERRLQEKPRRQRDGARGRALDTKLDREEYAALEENEFRLAKDEPLSTFSIDVDTASYTNVRRLLNDGQLPPAGAVRIEEMLNYFPYADAPPEAKAEVPFRVHTELFDAPWADGHQLLRIALATKAVPLEERAPANLVFLLDVSGSMNAPDKLPLLKKALAMLVRELNPRDRIAIVVYAGSAGLVLDSTPCGSPLAILAALERLEAGGSTNGGEGIRLAYDLAASHFVEGGTNRVILATDGDFNVGTSDTSSLHALAAEKAESGVFLTVLGFGTGNLQDSKMEAIADRGNGHYAYIDSVLEARKVLVDELGSTLEVVAKDVKIQVEFNPAEVQSWRLIGYENRALAARDFADDRKDAGEIGAGHHVTALYELVPTNGAPAEGEQDLRYQQERQPTGAAFSGELGLVKLRYKEPTATESRLVETPVAAGGVRFQEASLDARFAASVAAFGMKLRGSKFATGTEWGAIRRWAAEALGEDAGGWRAQMIGLVQRAEEISSLKSLGYGEER